MEHHCGVIGIITTDIHTKNHVLSINGLNKLQHRGYESAGISFIDQDSNLVTYKKPGLVRDIFRDYQTEYYKIAIGHVRYSTSSIKNDNQAQPFEGSVKNQKFSIVHNGNINFIAKIKEQYRIITDNESDTYILMKYIEKIYLMYDNWDLTLQHVMNEISGSFSLLILTQNKIYALRDRYGIRPLVMAGYENNYFIASESIAFEDTPYQLLCAINPGEIMAFECGKFQSIYRYTNPKQTVPELFCSFEYFYFMNQNSVVNNHKVENIRYRLGYELGLSEKNILDNSIVLSIPNSSMPSGRGFSMAINRPYKNYIKKNDMVNRTFILPTEAARQSACSNKFIIIQSQKLLEKNIYIVDDSIVRGITMKAVIKQLKEYNPLSIHIRIVSPPIISPCYFGIDMSTKDELFAHQRSIALMEEELQIDSLKYITLEAMCKILGSVCTSCFTGIYPSELLDW